MQLINKAYLMNKNNLFITILVAIIVVAVGYWMVQETPEEKTVKPVSQPNVVSQTEKKANSSVAHNNKRRKKENHKNKKSIQVYKNIHKRQRQRQRQPQNKQTQP